MASEKKPQIYFVLGAAGSGRREVIADLIADGLEDGDRAAIILAESERNDQSDAKLPAMTTWRLEGEVIAAELPAEATHVFFVSDGRRNPVEQIEAFKSWLESRGGGLARVIAVVNCQLAEKNPPLLAWYEACVHFADVVLLNRREGVDNKWLSGFLGHFKKQYYPCLFETVKAGQVQNPALVLLPEARRMTHVFDEEQDWIFTDKEGQVVDEEEETEGETEIEATPEEDPYFVRDAAGRRAKKLPDIAKYL